MIHGWEYKTFFDRPVTTFKSYLKKKEALQNLKKISKWKSEAGEKCKAFAHGCVGELQKTAAAQTEVQNSLLCNKTQMSVI